MRKKTILLIEDDPETEAGVREVLGKDYSLEMAKDEAAAIAFLRRIPPDLIIIDFDLKKKDGLQVFKNLQPSPNVIMLSASGSIPLAVSAAKSGVSEFLRKPLIAKQLKDAVEKNITREAVVLCGMEGMEWLRGENPCLRKMHAEIREALEAKRDIILVGERGISKEKVAEFIHLNGPKKGRKLARIDLSSFKRETLETHFWATIQELMGLPETTSLKSEEDLYGTIYLENFENLEELFKFTIFNFFTERKGKIDKSVRAVIGIYDRKELQKLKIKDYALIEIPPLRERKEDIPYLLGVFLKNYSSKYNRNVKFISTEVLDFLAAYDYPGNYLELESLVQEAVLETVSEKIELKNFPFDFKGLLKTSLKKGLGENLTLEEAKRRFEKSLYGILLEKSNEEKPQVARFLDIPKTSLVERLEDLTD